MDVQITDAVILGFAFWVGAMIAYVLLSRRYKKKTLALKDSVDHFTKTTHKHLCVYNSDNLETLKKLEAGDFEGAKHHVSYGIALFYHNECSTGLSKEFDIEREKIEELARFSPSLAADIKKVAEMQKIAVEMKGSRLTPRTYDKVGLGRIYDEAKELFLCGKYDQALEDFKAIYEQDIKFRDVASIIDDWYVMPKDKLIAKYKAQFRAKPPEESGEDAGTGSAAIPAPKRPITPSGSFRAERRPDEDDHAA